MTCPKKVIKALKIQIQTLLDQRETLMKDIRVLTEHTQALEHENQNLNQKFELLLSPHPSFFQYLPVPEEVLPH